MGPVEVSRPRAPALGAVLVRCGNPQAFMAGNCHFVGCLVRLKGHLGRVFSVSSNRASGQMVAKGHPITILMDWAGPAVPS